VTWRQLLESIFHGPHIEASRWGIDMWNLIALLAHLADGALEAAGPRTQCQAGSGLFQTCRVFLFSIVPYRIEFGGSCTNCVSLNGAPACSHAISMSTILLPRSSTLANAHNGFNSSDMVLHEVAGASHTRPFTITDLDDEEGGSQAGDGFRGGETKAAAGDGRVVKMTSGRTVG
jgi:hypothetical protein